jgi:DNA repair photolyase
MVNTSQLPLFEPPTVEPPTTREVAALIKIGGSEGLTGAVRMADDAVYQEVTCRSALNKVEGMPFQWTLNPYRGCTHGCHYCFARRYQTQFEMNAGDEFSSVILVKVNFVEVLRQELRRRSWNQEMVALGTATDPYQPIEGRYKLTHGVLTALCESATPVGIITKGPMVVRDCDLLVDLGRRARCSVCISIPTVDEEMWRRLEPGTAPPAQRLAALRRLVDAGIFAGALVAPIVPGLTSQRSRLEKTLKAIAEHGARFAVANVLHLEGGTREHFLNYLGRDFPEMVERYQNLYAGKYAPRAYSDDVRAVVAALKAKYGLSGRFDPDANEDSAEKGKKAARRDPASPSRSQRALPGIQAGAVSRASPGHLQRSGTRR